MSKLKKYRKIIYFALIVVAIFILDRLFHFSDYFNTDNIELLKDILNRNYLLAVIIYVVFTVVGCVLLAIPGVTFAIIAGLVFGPFFGTILCSLSTSLGAMGSFLVGRFFLKDSLKPAIEKNRYLKKWLFDETGQNELFVLMITRLVPLFPFNLQNFAYGITDINFGVYSLFSLIFMLPGTAMYTIGTAGLADRNNRVLYIGIALLLMLIVTLGSRYLKRRYFNEEVTSEKSMYFPGCNFYRVYPETNRKLEKIFGESGIGSLYGCCGKPLSEGGNSKKEEKNIKKIEVYLEDNNIKELIVACPNCYDYLSKKGLKVRTVYDKLRELPYSESLNIKGLDKNKMIYKPCPDRKGDRILPEIMTYFEDGPDTMDCAGCCGLSNLLWKENPEASKKMAKDIVAKAPDGLYTYCASCSMQLTRNGMDNCDHLLAVILNTEEKAKSGLNLFRRMIFKIKGL